MNRLIIANTVYQNIPPDAVDTDTIPTEMDDRKDLRVSLTAKCNLACAYCHNEGQDVPWSDDTTDYGVSLDQIHALVAAAYPFKVKSIKFTGGEPAIYPHFEALLQRIWAWREEFPAIKKWGMSSNGVAFLSPRKYQALVESPLDNICISLESVSPLERSKPSSPIGVSGERLFRDFIEPIARDWAGQKRSIKVNVVYTGTHDEPRISELVEACYPLGIDVGIIEVYTVHEYEKRQVIRHDFLSFLDTLADRYGLDPRVNAMNEIFLYELVQDGSKPQSRIKGYQDHCADLDCGNCRRIHLRVNPSPDGWVAVPCFLRAQSHVIPLEENGRATVERFRTAIRYNGAGPQWYDRADPLLAGSLPAPVSGSTFIPLPAIGLRSK